VTPLKAVIFGGHNHELKVSVKVERHESETVYAKGMCMADGLPRHIQDSGVGYAGFISSFRMLLLFR
jgi:hypothetical protein